MGVDEEEFLHRQNLWKGILQGVDVEDRHLSYRPQWKLDEGGWQVNARCLDARLQVFQAKSLLDEEAGTASVDAVPTVAIHHRSPNQALSQDRLVWWHCWLWLVPSPQRRERLQDRRQRWDLQLLLGQRFVRPLQTLEEIRQASP